MSNDLEIIAEIHPQHGGSPGMMREMIREAKLCGADMIKLQLYDAQKLLGPDWEYLSLSEDDCKVIQNWCDQESIELSASVFDRERLGWCLNLGMKHIKIASITLREDRRLCDEIVREAERVTISLGYWLQHDLPYPPSDRVRYLYCKSKYPAFYEDMGDFPERFSPNAITGYSDHTLGLGVSLLAIARGANVVEKHMTLSKTLGKKTEKAHICSMTPAELAELRRIGGELYRVQRVIRQGLA
jgi:sialic acid synthase SpsE